MYEQLKKLNQDRKYDRIKDMANNLMSIDEETIDKMYEEVKNSLTTEQQYKMHLQSLLITVSYFLDRILTMNLNKDVLKEVNELIECLDFINDEIGGDMNG